MERRLPDRRCPASRRRSSQIKSIPGNTTREDRGSFLATCNLIIVSFRGVRLAAKGSRQGALSPLQKRRTTRNLSFPFVGILFSLLKNSVGKGSGFSGGAGRQFGRPNRVC